MKKYFETLKRCSLFKDIAQDEVSTMLDCLNAGVKTYPKNATVFLSGDTISNIYIVLSGSVEIIQQDFSGNKTILAYVMSADLFGEAFACAGLQKSPVSAIATTNSEIMVIEFKRIVTNCGSACSFHTKLIENMLELLAWKNIALNSKNHILSKRTTRDKLLAYMAQQVQLQDSRQIKLPFNRNSLADFLGVDRSAMCRELGRMRDEGLMDFNKNTFELKNTDILSQQ